MVNTGLGFSIFGLALGAFLGACASTGAPSLEYPAAGVAAPGGGDSALERQKIVAIGEIGLDYYHVKDEDQRELQKEVFKMYLKAAEEYSLPVIIHARNAALDVLDILEDFRKTELFRGDIVLHCFEASVKNIQRALGLGCYFTIPASVERHTAKYSPGAEPEFVCQPAASQRLGSSGATTKSR